MDTKLISDLSDKVYYYYYYYYYKEQRNIFGFWIAALISGRMGGGVPVYKGVKKIKLSSSFRFLTMSSSPFVILPATLISSRVSSVAYQ